MKTKRHCFDFGSIAHNGTRITDVAKFEKQMFNLKTNLI